LRKDHNLYKIKICVLSFILIFNVLLNFAQNINEVQYDENLNIYRVVAVRNQNEQITSTSNIVIVEKPYAIYAPNAFSPDGDGLNDVFNVTGQGIIDFEMEIFNRWGQMVFKSYTLEDKWDGTFRGKDLPTGTYVYKIKIISYGENQKTVQSGTISLVR
tara:strand:+ start:133 stop:609 length:477 start_codon:yes stop_codon:yes gene_type:complete